MHMDEAGGGMCWLDADDVAFLLVRGRMKGGWQVMQFMLSAGAWPKPRTDH